MEHNRLAEEGYYLAIPSGRTKNFILSKRERTVPIILLSLFRRRRILVLSRFLAVFPFSCPPPGPFRNNTAGRFPFTSPCYPSGFLPFILPRKTRVTRGGCAAASLRQQSKIKIQKSARSKNRRKLDKSRPASAFFAHLPSPPVPRCFSFIQICGEKRPGGREGRPISSGRLTPESQIRAILFSSDDNNNRGGKTFLCRYHLKT